MRKANKILMATVAILLCLVLISTSVVSGIFAKFIIQKQTKFSMQIEKFGVKVYLIPDIEALKALGATVTPEVDNYNKNEASVTISNLNLIPGADLSKVLKIRFDGETNVPIDIRVTLKFTYTLGTSNGQYNFRVPSGIGNMPANGLTMVPVGVKFGAENIEEKIENGTTVETVTTIIPPDYVTELKPYHAQSADNAENYLSNCMQSKLDVTKTSDDNDYVSKQFNAGETIGFKTDTNEQYCNTFVFGFEWPKTYSLTRSGTTYDSDTMDRVSAYLSDPTHEKNRALSYTFTVKIEQTGA